MVLATIGRLNLSAAAARMRVVFAVEEATRSSDDSTAACSNQEGFRVEGLGVWVSGSGFRV